MNVLRFVDLDANEYKADVETSLQTIIHLPLHIGQLRTVLQGFKPSLILQNVVIDAPNSLNEPAMELKEVRVSLNLLQLIVSRDLLASSTFTLIGAKLSLLRDEQGRVTIQGIQSGDESPNWLLQGKKFQLLKSDIRWEDLKNKTAPVVFQQLDLLLKNEQQTHEIQLLSKLPEQYGSSVRISALLKGDFFELPNLEGSVYFDVVNLQSQVLAANPSLSGLKFDAGSADLQIWSDWRAGEITRVAAQVQAQQLKVSNLTGNSLKLDALQANVSWLQNDQGWRLNAYDVDISAGHQHWVANEFYFHQEPLGNHAVFIKQLDLSALAAIAPIVLTGASLLDACLKFKPSGQLNDFTLYLQADMQHFALKGGFNQLANNGQSLVRLNGFSGHVMGTESQGYIELQSNEVLIDAPQLFRQLLADNGVYGRINWLQQTKNWLFSSRDLQIENPDFKTETDFDLTLSKQGETPKLDLALQLTHFKDISKIPQYLPAQVMGKDALAWLDNAFLAGQINQGEILMQGDLNSFASGKAKGKLDVLLALENADISYNPDWPVLKEVNADIHFSGDDLQIAVHNANSKNVEVKQALITIPRLVSSNNVEVKGVLSSKINDALLFMKQTPLHSRVEPILKTLSSESDTQIDLDLIIPYVDADPVYVNVTSHLNNAELYVKPASLKFSAINGGINFGADRVSSQTLTANTLGYPVQAVLSSDASFTRLKLLGSTNMENLERQFSFLRNDFSQGAFAYQADLSIPAGINQTTSLSISSNLQGLEIESPFFLAKTAAEQMQLKLIFQFDANIRLPLHVEYGNFLNAAFLIDTQQNRLYSGRVALGKTVESAPEEEGLFVEVKQPEFKLSSAVGALSATDSRWPPLREIALDTQQMIWQGQSLGPMLCHFKHVKETWQGEIKNAMAQGRLSIPDEYAGDEPIKLDMDYLNLSSMNAFNFNDAEQVFTLLPLIDIDSRQVFWRTVNLGKLKLQTERLNNGTHFKKILFTAPNKEINFTADWLKQKQGTSTLINGTMKVNNFGQFLSELGYSDDFKETQADFSFTGGWNDAPQQFSIDKLNGQLQIRLTEGRITSIEPGFGRLLGLISMEQWAKRLSLDFTDIYRQGLAFDQINGDFKITNGVAYTDNLLIDAVSAKMRLVGTANLVTKTVDQRVDVNPKSSDALPIAGTIVDSIAAVITNAVTNDYKEGYFFGKEYKVTGHWGDIEVTPQNANDGLINRTWHGLTDFNWLKK
jgi:uncharacterized protein (TIGR02099 family)